MPYIVKVLSTSFSASITTTAALYLTINRTNIKSALRKYVIKSNPCHKERLCSFHSVLYIRLTLMALFIGLQQLIYPLWQNNHKSLRSLILYVFQADNMWTNVCLRMPFKLLLVVFLCFALFFLESLTRQLIWKSLMMTFFSTKGA